MRKLLLALLLLAAPAVGQLCDETFTLRTTACPAGSDCVNKGAAITGAEYDANVTNDINVCLAFDDTDVVIAIDGRWQFDGELEVPASTTPPATCTQGELYVDTDVATPAERLLFCSATDTWTVPGGGVGGGATSENELESDLADVTDVYTDNDTDYIDSDDMADDDHGDISWSSGSASIDDNTIDSAQINNDSILAEDLYSDNVGADGDILVFSDTLDNFIWQTAAELNIASTSHAADHSDGGSDEVTAENLATACTDAQVLGGDGSGGVECQADVSGGSGAWVDANPVLLETTTDDVAIGAAQKNSSKLTVDGDADVIQTTIQCHSTQTTNPECFLVETSTGTVLFSVEVDGTVNMSESAAPTIALKDSDSVADPPDDNATISGNLTNTGDGTENMDVLFQQQRGGAPTTYMSVDADVTGDGWITFPDSSIGANELMATGQTVGYFLQLAAGPVLQWAVGAGGAFDDSSNPIVQYTPSKRTEFGDGAGTLAGKVEIGGMANEPTLVLEAYAGQTADIFVAQNDADTEMFTIAPDGTTTIAGSTSTISGSGTYVEIDDVLYLTPAATPPIACTTNGGIIYHDDSGVICICDGASAWVEWVDYSGTGACS